VSTVLPLVVAVLLEPEARRRRVQHPEQTQVGLNRRALGQLDHRRGLLEDLAAAVEHEMVVTRAKDVL
jgi:hypothetical protein